MSVALPCQRLPMVLIQAVSSTDGRGSHTRVPLSVLANSTRVVTSKPRQPLSGAGLKLLSAALAGRVPAQAALAVSKVAVLKKRRRSMESPKLLGQRLRWSASSAHRAVSRIENQVEPLRSLRKTRASRYSSAPQATRLPPFPLAARANSRSAVRLHGENESAEFRLAASDCDELRKSCKWHSSDQPLMSEGGKEYPGDEACPGCQRVSANPNCRVARTRGTVAAPRRHETRHRPDQERAEQQGMGERAIRRQMR